MNFINGKFLANIKRHMPNMLYELGRFLGALDNTRKGFYHPAAHRYVLWDLNIPSAPQPGKC